MSGSENIFFSQKDTVRLVYSWVDSAVLALGLSLNLLLIYLIRTKTDLAMRIYQKLLTLSCAMDLIVACWTFLVQPFPVCDHGYRAILLNGIFRNYSQPIRYAAYLIWIQMLLFFLVTTMCQYVYRYCILCRNGEMSPSIFWSLVLLQLFLNGFHGFLIAWADYPRSGDAAKMGEMKRQIANETGITDIEFIAFVHSYEFRWLMHTAIMCVMFPVFYAIIGFCFISIKRAVYAMNVLKFREYNKQVSAALLFQAILPTLEVVALCIQIFTPILVANESTVWVVLFSDIPVHLVPVLNPLGTILLVAPYRRALFGYLGISAAKSTIVRTSTIVLGPLRGSNKTAVHPQALEGRTESNGREEKPTNN